jgi:hypothetical protein
VSIKGRKGELTLSCQCSRMWFLVRFRRGGAGSGARRGMRLHRELEKANQFRELSILYSNKAKTMRRADYMLYFRKQ